MDESTAIVAASGWRRASVRADRSHRVNAYLLGAIGALNPSKLGGSQISLKQALDELSGQLGAELDGAPDLAADVHHALGQQYLEIGSLPEAESHFRAAMEARAIVFGEDAIETMDSTMTLAIVLRRQERPGEAIALLEPSIARLRARGAPPLEFAEALNDLAARGGSALVARTRMLVQMQGAAMQLHPQDTASRGDAAATQYWGLTGSFVARMTSATGC
ncbi:MAG: tetratricopeptide repeat protein [Phycisphaerae bacterium]|nr:tetratricopeptide repeat protein [Phycisphaerae bacterium]